MKIEKGKFYCTRGGEKVEVLTTEREAKHSIVAMGKDGSISVLFQNGMLYDGKVCSDADIISEWTDPVEIPWSDYPTWCKWVAMDADGDWCGHSEKPTSRNNRWLTICVGVSLYIPTDYTPRNFTGDWTKSLFERPNN
jgi:hypothetical protein